ncbi:MAG TPA: ABC transporter permease [Bryobacteraceae bacterium]|nr:ABC transporter permease [Bryobacteraceae bacterium]
MRAIRLLAIVFLLATAAISLAADWLAPHDYAEQFRDHAGEPPSPRFPAGTDELGRDRASRLLHACRTSLLLALGTASLAISLAAIIGGVAGFRGGWVDSALSSLMDLMLSLPWLFLLLTVRALLPLNTSPSASISATAALIGLAGWAPAARVIRANVLSVRNSAPLLYARACGLRDYRLLAVHLLPNLKPVLRAQFWIFVPVFLLTEANLGLLGLGILEPMPSLGSMLAELQNYDRIPSAPWMLTPAFLLLGIVTSLHLAMAEAKTWE